MTALWHTHNNKAFTFTLLLYLWYCIK